LLHVKLITMNKDVSSCCILSLKKRSAPGAGAPHQN
jgi:hypothetical protein